MAYDCMTQGLWQVKNSYSLVFSPHFFFFFTLSPWPNAVCTVPLTCWHLKQQIKRSGVKERRRRRRGQSQAVTCPDNCTRQWGGSENEPLGSANHEPERRRSNKASSGAFWKISACFSITTHNYALMKVCYAWYFGNEQKVIGKSLELSCNSHKIMYKPDYSWGKFLLLLSHKIICI